MSQSPFFFLLILLFQAVFTKQQKVHGRNHVLLPMFEIPNDATSLFLPQVLPTEMHGHVSALGEQCVNVCCAYTQELQHVR